MDRALLWSPEAQASLARRIAAAALLAASGGLARLALRVERPAAVARPAQLEVGFIDIDGQRRAAVYADGRLIGVVPDSERL